MITTSEVIHIKDDGISYRPDVRYRFTYRGEVYESECIAQEFGVSSKLDNAQSYTEMFKQGATVSAFINPRKPHQSLLMPGVNGDAVKDSDY